MLRVPLIVLLLATGDLLAYLVSSAFFIIPTVFSWWLRVAKPQKVMSSVQ